MSQPFRVCLAPGHGGADSGACANGHTERDLCKAQAWALGQVLTARGYDAHILSATNRRRNATEQAADNRARVQAANAHDALLLCLHFNSGGGRYGLVEYAADNPQSDLLARAMCKRLQALLGPIVSDVRHCAISDGERGHICVGGAIHTALILEPLFLDCWPHAVWLRSHDNRQALAVAYADAIDDLAAELSAR